MGPEATGREARGMNASGRGVTHPGDPSGARGRPRRCRGEEGDSTLAVVLCLPVLLLVIMALSPLVFWYHARHVATAAAQAGSRAARVVGGTPEAGEAKAADVLSQLGPRLVLEPVVTAIPGPGDVTVEVRGQAPHLLPGFPVSVSASSTGALEQFRGDG